MVWWKVITVALHFCSLYCYRNSGNYRNVSERKSALFIWTESKMQFNSVVSGASGVRSTGEKIRLNMEKQQLVIQESLQQDLDC